MCLRSLAGEGLPCYTCYKNGGNCTLRKSSVSAADRKSFVCSVPRVANQRVPTSRTLIAGQVESLLLRQSVLTFV
jgi:hypothetical protein